MIPSLVAEELRAALVEYLATTFALNDDDARAALEAFLEDPVTGIYRGPFLRVRTPFRLVGEEWVAPLDWLPEGFRPYQHQAAAFERLSSRGREPLPTLVTTGTGSGKTEAFLYPILDHCARERRRGRHGIKALLLYPMNALATDQARRLAGLLHGDPRLGGVTAGLFIGAQTGRKAPDAEHLVDDHATLRRSPPDILLTNYKMLDLLLLLRHDAELWAAGEPGTLRYVVLDEFHTYDGAQGTDVAMLLRRLGARLGLARPGRPLGGVAPVATSATLGAGTESAGPMREFAERVFGVPFGPDSVIGEHRQTIDEACGKVDYSLPIPDVGAVLAVPEHDFNDRLNGGLDDLAVLFTGEPAPAGRVELGARLLRHPLTRAVLAAAGSARGWEQALELVSTRAPSWGAVYQADPLSAYRALARYLALLSVARRPGRRPGEELPLFSIEVQLWVREVRRLLRALDERVRFRWLDSAEPERPAPAGADPGGQEPEHGDGGEPEHLPELPAVYCHHCGRAGWMGLATELDGRLRLDPVAVYQASTSTPKRLRAAIRATAGEAGAAHLDRHTGMLLAEPGEGTLPVLVTRDEDEARRGTCPSCQQEDGIAFLGARVASLASVCISQLFGSRYLPVEERKLLAFTDAVQDAAHRAAFFSGRTYRFNHRTEMAREVAGASPLPLGHLGEAFLDEARGDPGRLYALTPPDLLDDSLVASLWGGGPPRGGARERLAHRLGLEAAMEAGLRARVGRTLELTGTVAASVRLPDLDKLAEQVRQAREDYEDQQPLGLAATPGGVTDPDYAAYLRGFVERLRLRGGILHPWLERYVAEDGARWWIWRGREDGMPAFPFGQSLPSFLTTGRGGDGRWDSLRETSSASWLVDWAMRTLGTPAGTARRLNRWVAERLAEEEVLARRTGRSGATIYGIDPDSVVLHDVPDGATAADPGGAAGDGHPGVPWSLLRCDTCLYLHAAPPERVEDWIGVPCLRYRCAGRYRPSPPSPGNYYRRLYRAGAMRRVVTAEHTGLLDPRERAELEDRFKDGTAVDAPNVLVCTPTMELGIDVGDLSAVLLTSVPRGPASYVQRVGRAGRRSGNAFVAAFLPTEPRALYYLAQPEHMIAGEVRPPSCYLDAVEILRRQYLAFLIDRAAAGLIAAPPMPARIGGVLAGGRLAPDGWLRSVVGASSAPGATHVDDFLALFDGLRPETVRALREHAATGLAQAVERALAGWQARLDDLGRRRDRLSRAIKQLEDRGYLEEEQKQELRRLRGERYGVVDRMRQMRQEPTLQALEGIGLLPNYTLIDDAATLEVTLWWEDATDGKIVSEQYAYQRPAEIAVTEFAPGNHFYVKGHRLLIDALEIGAGTEPLYEDWRLCPECGYGAVEASRPRWDACPRCGQTAIADAGASHQVLRMRRVYSADSKDRTKVLDDSDEREHASYHLMTTVDIDPADVGPAWGHKHAVFGMEFARSATVRWVNFGQAGLPGSEVMVAGERLPAPRFRTCRWCGMVDGARRRGRTEHRGWCYTRSGARTESWDHPVLAHELRTEAVRLLLPVSTFEVAERLASFKGALLLGLRLDFGGEPEHLDVVPSTFPGSGGHGRRRFLVLHDTVPGGTGYLARVADPERLRRILDLARDAISRCPCRDEGRAACHRCLLGAVDPREIGLVSRALALELLDQLLDEWDFEPVDGTIATLAIHDVEESELERRFRVALRAWADRPERGASLVTRPGPGGRSALELRLTAGGDTLRYLIEEQRPLDTSPKTVPDYLITRQDDAGPQIAVYLDGEAFHASPRSNRIAGDAAKRHAVRASGRIVWNLTWDDVEAFDQAARADLLRDPPDRPLLPPHGQRIMKQAQHARHGGGKLDPGVAHHNPMRQLLDLLHHPNLAAWEDLACSAVAGLAQTAAVAGNRPAAYEPGALPAVVATALRGDQPPAGRPQAAGTPARSGDGHSGDGDAMAGQGGTAYAIHARSLGGLPLTCLLDARSEGGGASAERWTVLAVLDDRDRALHHPDHPARWRDWLQWANLLQFLRTGGRAARLTAVSDPDLVDPGDLPIVPSPAPEPAEPAATGDLDPAAAEELELILDDAARALTEAALLAGAPTPIAGYELGDEDAMGWAVEVAWPQHRVAVLTDADGARDAWLAANGWDARATADWTVDMLLAALAPATPDPPERQH